MGVCKPFKAITLMLCPNHNLIDIDNINVEDSYMTHINKRTTWIVIKGKGETLTLVHQAMKRCQEVWPREFRHGSIHHAKEKCRNYCAHPRGVTTH